MSEKPLKYIRSKDEELLVFGEFCLSCTAKDRRECARCLKAAIKMEKIESGSQSGRNITLK